MGRYDKWDDGPMNVGLKMLESIDYSLCHEDSPQHRFYTQSMLHNMICNYLFLNKDVNLEKICRHIPKRIGGRTTIYEVLTQGLGSGLLNKQSDDQDKRLRIYTLADGLWHHMEKYWLKPFEDTGEENERLLSKKK